MFHCVDAFFRFVGLPHMRVQGGLTGSALADLIEAAGGAANRFSGMRDREAPSPAFPFLPVAPLTTVKQSFFFQKKSFEHNPKRYAPRAR